MRTTARIIPVIDVKGGQVVHAVAGRRSEYKPLKNPDPHSVAVSMLNAVNARELYIADLDAITTGTADRNIVNMAASLAATVCIDFGSCEHDNILPANVKRIFSTESWDLSKRLPQQELCSVDFFDGVNEGLADAVIAAGFRRLILLDVKAVGTSRGLTTLDLARRLNTRHPHLELIAGGGVRNWDDVRLASDAGFDAVLAATAIHNGSLIDPRRSKTLH